MTRWIPVREDRLDKLINMAGNSIPDNLIVNAIQNKTLQSQLRRSENQIQTDFSKLFRKTQKNIINKISEHYGFDEHLKEVLASEIESLRHPMVLTLEKGLQDAIKIGGQEATNHLNELSGSKYKYEPFDPKVRELLEKRASDAVEQSLKTINDTLMDKVAMAYEKGWNSEKASREIASTMDGIESKNLKTLTRTEMHSAKMQARQLSYQERGVEFTIWLTSEDDLVRGNDPRDEADHVVLHKEITRLDDVFSNGLLYPGDMSGDISEWINCRCDYRPWLMPLGMEFTGDGPFKEEDLVEVQNTVTSEDVTIPE